MFVPAGSFVFVNDRIPALDDSAHVEDSDEAITERPGVPVRHMSMGWTWATIWIGSVGWANI
jgi:hypothetical protein